jgi:hypothetical protein
LTRTAGVANMLAHKMTSASHQRHAMRLAR